MDPITILTLIASILSMILHGIQIKNSKCHAGHDTSCCGCNVALDDEKQNLNK